MKVLCNSLEDLGASIAENDLALSLADAAKLAREIKDNAKRPPRTLDELLKKGTQKQVDAFLKWRASEKP